MPHPTQPDVGHVFERLKFVQIADARVGHHGNGDGVLRSSSGGAAVVEYAVFFRQTVVAPHGDGGQSGHAREGLQLCGGGCQQAGVATKFVGECALKFKQADLINGCRLCETIQ